MKRYRYYFRDLDTPISIEAIHKISARNRLEELCNQQEFIDKGYSILNIIKETQETLVDGVSTKTIKNENYTWNGNGWAKS